MDTGAKGSLLELLYKLSTELSWDELSPFSAAELAQQLQVSRNLVSQYLNEYLEAGTVVKVNTRPVYYFHKAGMGEKLHKLPSQQVYSSLADLREDLALHPVVYSPFEQLVGSLGSLRYCVEQCKAAISYPDGGLPILIQGPTGTGKSVLAQVTYEYAVSKGILTAGSRFVTVNCSEYANNPELLLTNLFGHRKGAYTGADRDRKGLIALADGGVLFMDEVHCLKSECQEKLFLFMDKGIYHMVGDNETWYSSSVRLIFATTECAEGTLLRTMLRRIPITTHVPPLEGRPLQDKKELIYKVLLNQSERTGYTISISALAYHALLGYQYPGNVGQLGNCIKASIANAIVRSGDAEGRTVTVQMYDLPDYLVTSESTLAQHGQHSDKALLTLDALAALSREETRLITLGNGALHVFNSTCLSGEQFWKAVQPQLEKYTDFLFFTESMGKNPREEIALGVLTNTFNAIAKKHSIGCLSNNEILTAAKFLCDYLQSTAASTSFCAQRGGELDLVVNRMRESLPTEYSIACEAAQMIAGSMNVQLDRLGFLVLLLYVRSFGNDFPENRIAGIILAHGYSTASSIAQAANHLLSGYYFDAIDMPVDSRPETISAKLAERIQSMGAVKDIIIMVDMGSLEAIYKELRCAENMNVGVINSITTRMALHIGTMIQQGLPVAEILEKASAGNVCTYTILENRVRPEAILTVCATGIGTAEKIARLIEDSMPRKVELLLLPYDFDSLRSMGRQSPVFAKYNVRLIAGTLDPQIEGVPFVSVEEIVEQHNEVYLSGLLSPYLSAEELTAFNLNIIRNFSLQNLLNYLTILNPEKIVLFVEQIINALQERLDTVLDSATKVGLYLHISCLIERLITDRYIVNYAGLEDFCKHHADFIDTVKACFGAVERSYSVTIPISEIGYLYEYIYRRPETVSKDLKTVSMFND